MDSLVFKTEYKTPLEDKILELFNEQKKCDCLTDTKINNKIRYTRWFAVSVKKLEYQKYCAFHQKTHS